MRRALMGANSGGGSVGWTTDEIIQNIGPSGDITYTGTRIEHAALACKPITSFYGPNVTYSGLNPFAGCELLEVIDLPSLQSAYGGFANIDIQSGASHRCAVSTLNLPALTSIVSQLFNRLPNLKFIHLPSVTSMGTNAFGGGAVSVETIVFGTGLSRINANSLVSSSIKTVVLPRTSSLVILDNTTNALPYKPTASAGSITIYIPKVLFDELDSGSSLDYKAASNWSAYNDNAVITWAQIEGSEFEQYV